MQAVSGPGAGGRRANRGTLFAIGAGALCLLTLIALFAFSPSDDYSSESSVSDALGIFDGETGAAESTNENIERSARLSHPHQHKRVTEDDIDMMDHNNRVGNGKGDSLEEIKKDMDRIRKEDVRGTTEEAKDREDELEEQLEEQLGESPQHMEEERKAKEAMDHERKRTEKEVEKHDVHVKMVEQEVSDVVEEMEKKAVDAVDAADKKKVRDVLEKAKEEIQVKAEAKEFSVEKEAKKHAGDFDSVRDEEKAIHDGMTKEVEKDMEAVLNASNIDDDAVDKSIFAIRKSLEHTPNRKSGGKVADAAAKAADPPVVDEQEEIAMTQDMLRRKRRAVDQAVEQSVKESVEANPSLTRKQKDQLEAVLEEKIESKVENVLEKDSTKKKAAEAVKVNVPTVKEKVPTVEEKKETPDTSFLNEGMKPYAGLEPEAEVEGLDKVHHAEGDSKAILKKAIEMEEEAETKEKSGREEKAAAARLQILAESLAESGDEEGAQSAALASKVEEKAAARDLSAAQELAAEGDALLKNAVRPATRPQRPVPGPRPAMSDASNRASSMSRPAPPTRRRTGSTRP